METKTVNLRDLPEDFVRQAKVHAALSGMTLKDYFIKAVLDAMRDDEGRSSAASVVPNQGRPRKRKS